MIIDNISYVGSGLHSWYHNVGNGIGAKVYKRSNSMSMAQREYLFNIYAQNELPGLVNEVYSCGTIEYIIKKRIKLLPVIWMNHIEGMTCSDYFRQRMYMDEFNIIGQMNEICNHLKRIGFDSGDHLENNSNFMIDYNRKVIAIDFSWEIKYASKEFRKKVYELYSDKLKATYPPFLELIS